LFEGVCIAHRQCLPPLCKSAITGSSQPIRSPRRMRGAERRWKFERCRSLCLRGKLAGCEDPLQAHRSQPSLENETLSSFAILISRRPTSISVAGQPTVNVTPRSRHHRLKLDILRCGFLPPAPTTAARGCMRAAAHRARIWSARRPVAPRVIPLPTMTSGSLTGYPCSAPDRDHMLRKSCSRTACHKRCSTHPPLPASSHPPGPSPAPTAARRRPPDSASPSHRS
jgi:hypothetical protein